MASGEQAITDTPYNGDNEEGWKDAMKMVLMIKEYLMIRMRIKICFFSQQKNKLLIISLCGVIQIWANILCYHKLCSEKSVQKNSKILTFIQELIIL